MKFMLSFIFINILLYNNLIIKAEFQTSIFSEVNSKKEGENVILSPLSIFQVLGLTANGAVGETQSEMVSTLGESSIDTLNSVNYKLLQLIKNFVSVEIANGVMSTFDPIKSFAKICDKYEAPIEKLISVNQVNEWCSQKTHGKIPKIIDELDPSMLLLLLNAVYFRGEWTYPFNPERTYGGVFFNFGKEEKKVEIMTQTNRFMFYKDKEIQAVELPYKNDSMSAVIILPNKEIDINKYVNENKLNDDFINKILEGMDETSVKVSMPKFEVEFSMKLKEVLINLGMTKAFGDADFSGINGEGGLSINNVIHKTYLKVDEIGSEAAAVTIVEVRSIAEEEIEINRPFILVIKSKELPKGNNFLFISKIEEI